MVYLQDGRVLIDGGRVAINRNCCCEPSWACCKCDGTCEELTQSECANTGGTWLEGRTCEDNICCTGTVSHIELTISLSGTATTTETPTCNASWDVTGTASIDFDPCDGIIDIGVAATGFPSCSGHICSPQPIECFVVGSIRSDGIFLAPAFAFVDCQCTPDCGYASSVDGSPVFDTPTWCGWHNAGGSYSFSDTVTWNLGVTSGTANWSLTISVS